MATTIVSFRIGRELIAGGLSCAWRHPVADTDLRLRIPFTTLLKVALAILLVAIVVKLWPVIVMVIIAVLIAVMFDPLVVWLEGHRAPRAFGITLVAIVLFGTLVVFLVVLIPAISRQLGELSKQLPQIAQRIASAFPPAAPWLQGIRGGPQKMTTPQMRIWFERGLDAGEYAVLGLAAVIFVLVLAVYLLAEGRQAFEWLVSFVPAHNRKRAWRTALEMSGMVRAYTHGVLITATICSVYVFAVLTALRVPVPLLLAVIAFVCDFVPVVGTIVMTVPAALLALVISPLRATLVIGAYLFYHLLENYVIIPRIYGTQLRLSTLTVLLAIVVGGTLQGVIGAVIALPIVAAYPIVERIWLREHLQPDTVPRHEAIEDHEPSAATDSRR
jgi:predicted PurR-regulated permease PerM